MRGLEGKTYWYKAVVAVVVADAAEVFEPGKFEGQPTSGNSVAVVAVVVGVRLFHP